MKLSHTGYELIASTLAEAHAGEVARLYAAKRHISAVTVDWYYKRLVAEVADRLAATNPNFDRQRFIAAAHGAEEKRLSDAHAYAQRRANETGRRYMVSEQGKAMAYCPENLAMLYSIDDTPVAIYSPCKDKDALTVCPKCNGTGRIAPDESGYDGCDQCNYGEGPTGFVPDYAEEERTESAKEIRPRSRAR